MSRVLADGGDPVGWLWLGTAPTAGDGLWVFDVEIDEPYRGQGLGRATMLVAEDVARARGSRCCGSTSSAPTRRRWALYRSLGFQVDASQMSKRLGAEDAS